MHTMGMHQFNVTTPVRSSRKGRTQQGKKPHLVEDSDSEVEEAPEIVEID